jgi:hypothetical protein
VATTFGWNYALHGGGLWTGQRVTLDFVTFAQNAGKAGSDIYSSMPGLASLSGTIVDVPASNTACFNTVGSSGFNLDRDGSCGLGMCAPDWTSRCAADRGTGRVWNLLSIPAGGEVDILLYGGVSATGTEPLTTIAIATQAWTTTVDTNPSNNAVTHVARVWR